MAVAEVVVPKALFGEILDRIGRLRASPELACSLAPLMVRGVEMEPDVVVLLRS
ncbi:MAG: hypothetical protein ACYSU4_19190 [Planctomycetota bacterium]